MNKNLYLKLYVSLAGLLGSTSAIHAQCATVSSFSENFDAYSSPNSIVPTCWDRVALNGASQIISSTQPASGTSQIYQNGYGAGKISIVIMPLLTNINSGTHHLRVKMKANGAGYLEFGYIKDALPETFVLLQPITITNPSYDSTSERIFMVPATVPDGMRLAIRNPGTSFAGHYWDDAVWEPIPNLGTHENDLSAGIKVYPNPFYEVLNITETKDVEKITVHDAVGRLVRTFDKPAAALKLSELAKGAYFVNLQFKNGSEKSFKAVKD